MKLFFQNLLSLILIICLLLVSRVVLAHEFANYGQLNGDLQTSLIADGVARTQFGLSLDALGAVHVCFVQISNQNSLTHVSSGGLWQSDVIEANLSGNDECAITITSDGAINVVYTKKAVGQLKIARKVAGLWNISVIDANFQANNNLAMTRHISLSTSRDRTKLGVAYNDGSGEDLEYAEYIDGNWQLETLAADGDQGTWPALGFTEDNEAIISYVKNFRTTPELWLIEKNGAVWSNPIELDSDGAVGKFNTLAVDANNRIHISYYADATDDSQQLRYLFRDEDGIWQDAINISTRQWNWLSANVIRMTVGEDGNAFFLYNWEFVSGLFPDVSYLEMVSVYFAPQLGISAAAQAVDTVAFNALRSFNFEETAITVDANYNGYLAWVEDGANDTYNLNIKRISNWRPAVRLLTPNEQSHSSRDDLFIFEWLDFDPDSNALMRMSWVDENWEYHVFAEGLGEDGENQATISTEDVPSGAVPIVLQISNTADFSDNYSASWASWNLTVVHEEDDEGDEEEMQNSDPVDEEGELQSEGNEMGENDAEEDSIEDTNDTTATGDPKHFGHPGLSATSSGCQLLPRYSQQPALPTSGLCFIAFALALLMMPRIIYR